MIQFTIDGKDLLVRIESELPPKENVYLLRWNTADACYANLLGDHLRSKLNNKLRAIREEAYEQGWKDAKAKRKKKDWFSGWW